MKAELLKFMALACHYAQDHIDDWDDIPGRREELLQCTSYQVACFLAQNTVKGGNGVEWDVVLASLTEHPMKLGAEWERIIAAEVEELGGWKDPEPGPQAHQFAFIRVGDAVVDNQVVVEMLSEKGRGDMVLEGFVRGVTAWVRDTEEGRDAWRDSSGDLNIGDLLSSHDMEGGPLAECLAAEGITGVRVLYEMAEGEAVSYDRVLVDKGFLAAEANYRITCRQLVPDGELHPLDREEGPSSEPYLYTAAGIQEALDKFHGEVPIKVLDDYEITCEQEP